MIFRLAVKDILHDWLLSICLVLAIASIIAPLLILFGLKSGTIQTLRGRLVEDPHNREIRPIVSKAYPKDWFTRVRSDFPEISFVVPMTRQISTSVEAKSPAGVSARFSLMATAENDPLLLENGVVIPGENGCVLTQSAARALDIHVGEMIELSTGRIIRGKSEKGTLQMEVSGILGERVNGLQTAYVRLKVIEAVEAYKDGRAVPDYGWKGLLPVAYPVYDGAVVFSSSPLSRLEEVMLINNTGFGSVKKLSPEIVAQTLGFQPSTGWNIYLAAVKKRAANVESIQAVSNKLRGKGALVFPWVKPVEALVSGNSGEGSMRLKLFAVSKKISSVSSLNVAPLFSLVHSGQAFPATVMLPGIAGDEAKKRVMTIVAGERKLTFPVKVFAGHLQKGRAFIPASLAGKINLLHYRNVVYDKNTGNLLLDRRGYAGFRMYTQTIDQVAGLQQKLEQQGIGVHTERQRIADVQRLDSYMSLIFWLIATVGVIGGISALTASLYASVERKKKELNILRLLGFLRREIILFPVSQGLLLSFGGLLLASLVFGVVGRVINQLFRSHLRTAESLCTLSVLHFVILAAGIGACAVFSASLAALQATRLDPAEALRDE